MARLRRLLLRSLYLVLAVAALATLATWLSAGRSQPLDARIHRPAPATPAAARAPGGTLRVMTLNLAHGRRDSLNQLFLSKRTIRHNLAQIAALIRLHGPDAIALQEADHVSFWSGGFDHITFLATHSGLRYSVHGLHVDGLEIRYGTALLSRHRPQKPYSYVFKPSPPTFSKGFVVTTIDWPGDPDFKVDLVSVHLDYSRDSVRRQQLREMLDFLRRRGRPTVLMGDFNIDWYRSKGESYRLLRRHGFHAIKPAGGRQVTFPSDGTRLDWIFVSRELRLESETIIDKNLSDHYAVIASIKRRRTRSLTATGRKSTD